ncbi:hypothetical protein K435DRAFT_850231 [Dendrothele bispora CBS 962.96]|uniref:Uncharacterized protein n=1 Tax=Dendrothele bispora (strain CBS 962.96) TaxID=1314807 RepID=A0A4S8MPU0_DENBC|nr:hypothetical protein K435DRAFT_850231 [Dendrothele bispora CBS 962.96]
MDDLWSSQDLDLFFRALARHSRLRPDLIALEIKSKSYTDVCVYLDALECAAASQKQIPELRRKLDVAMQVSNEWVSFEEKRAAALLAADKPHTEEIQVEGSNRQEDILKILTTHHLRALEAILQEEEDLTFNRHDKKPTMDSEGGIPQASDEQVKPLENEVIVPDPSSPSSPSIGQILTEDLSQLSPNSRRRLKKRLYMRKRRAEAAGVEINTNAVRLRPGRRSKIVAEDESKGDMEDESEDEDDEENLDANDTGDVVQEKGGKRRKKPSKIVKIVKLRKEFDAHGVTHETLYSDGLGFFHLDVLARLLKDHRRSYASSSQLITSISSDILRVLKVLLIDFVTELVQRSIVFKEQEIKVKSDTKAWRSVNGEVSAEHVEKALSVMNPWYFVISDCLPSPDEYEETDEAEGGDSEEEDFGEDDEGDGMGSGDPKDEPRCFHTFHGAPPYVPVNLRFNPEDLLTIENGDQEDLLRELDEEDDLDKQDGDVEMRYEEELWNNEFKQLEGRPKS